jgi:two-component sensor histidine kinase
MPTPAPDKAVARLLRQQAALANFGSYAFREPVLLNILNEAARVCAEGLDVPFCKICRYRPDENDLLIEAGYGWHAGVIGLVVSKADETSPQGRAYVTGAPIIIENLREANNVILPAFYGEHGITSTVDVIIKGRDGQPYGVLEIDSQIQHTYDKHDVAFLTGFANVLAEAVATSVRDAMVRQTLQEMATAVAEKDVMAEELKHRVRNNLQLVLGMLTSHLKASAHQDDNASINAIIRRVTTLSEVYEQLLGTGLGREVDLGEYLKALCRSLPRLQRQAHDGVTLTCVAEPLSVDLDTVTAMGMVVAELVSNSYEHAFAEGHGNITILLRRSKRGDEAVLTVQDDGSGFIEKPGSKRHGVGLIRRLLAQVQGTATLLSDLGTRWVFRFPIAMPADEPATPTVGSLKAG